MTATGDKYDAATGHFVRSTYCPAPCTLMADHGGLHLDADGNEWATGALRAWTYTVRLQPGLRARECDEANDQALAQARHDVPHATAVVVGHRDTPTGRHAITIHRTRPEGTNF